MDVVTGVLNPYMVDLTIVLTYRTVAPQSISGSNGLRDRL